ncbi:unnamed protein product [Arctogadus glacialis]
MMAPAAHPHTPSHTSCCDVRVPRPPHWAPLLTQAIRTLSPAASQLREQRPSSSCASQEMGKRRETGRAANHSLNPAQPAAQPCSPPSQLTAQPAAQTAAPGSHGYLGSPVVCRFSLLLVSMAVVAPC